MKAMLLKESLQTLHGDLFPNNRGLFGVMELDSDFIDVTFYDDEARARESFDDLSSGILFSLNGPGELYAGRDTEGTGGVTVIDEKFD